MREATVGVERKHLVNVAPEKVWELTGSLAALSVSPGWFAFGVPGAVRGTDRLCCVLVSGQGSFNYPSVDISRVRSVVMDVRKEIPGQLISWQALGTEPAGKRILIRVVAYPPWPTASRRGSGSGALGKVACNKRNLNPSARTCITTCRGSHACQ